MTIKDGIKFGIGFVIGQGLIGFTAGVLKGCLEMIEKSEQTENKDVEVE